MTDEPLANQNLHACQKPLQTLFSLEAGCASAVGDFKTPHLGFPKGQAQLSLIAIYSLGK